MDTAPSPAPSSARSFLSDVLSDDEWDLLSEPGRVSPHPHSTAGDSDSDHEPPHTVEYIHDLVSGFSTGDELDDDDRPFDDDLLRESDRRVNTALANSLSSTLEPFREPLPSYINASVSSSSEGSGLVLSFPDPLTPSQELRLPLAKPIEASPANELTEEAAVPEPVTTVYQEERPAEPPTSDATPAVPEPSPAAPLESAKPDPADATEEILISSKDARDLRKIASYAQRKKAIQERAPRRLNVNALAGLLQGPPVPQSWTTSIIVSVLVLVLGSALFAARTHMLSTQALETPIRHTANVLPMSTPDSKIANPVTGANPIPITPALLLQTPGAGPSTATAASSNKAWGSPSTVKDSEVKAAADLTRAETGTRVGTTRYGGATAVPAYSGFWSKGKGKEKEVVEVNFHDETQATQADAPAATLRLDGPKSPLTLSYICRDVLNGLKYALTDPAATKHLALSTVNFEELLDELIARIIDRTTSILRELTTVAETAANQADVLINSAPAAIQSAKEAIVRHHSKVKSNTRKFVKGVRAHHRRAKANARKSFKATYKINSLVDGVMAHHKRVKANTRRGCKMMEEGLKAVVDKLGKQDSANDNDGT